MKLTRTQTIVLAVLGVLTVVVYGCLVSTIVRNSRQTSSAYLAAAQTQTARPSPTPTSTPTPTLTPTPIPPAPQTRYDLQVTRDPQNPALRVQRGYAYIMLKTYTYAVQDFDTAIGLDAGLTEAYVGRGEAHYYLREWSAALADFERALALNPELADAHTWRGSLLSARGEVGPALEALRQAVALDEQDPQKRILLGQALFSSGNLEEARIEYTAALALDSRSTAAYAGRAMTYAEQNDFDAAQADLYSALDIAPYDPVVLNSQAWLYAWYRHDHLAEAERLARRAIASAEDDFQKATYLDTLGWVYYQQGRDGEAIPTLEQAAALATVEGQVVYRDILDHLEAAKTAQP